MWIKGALALLLGGVAASVVVFYFWEESMNEVIQAKKKRYLEDCLRRIYANSNETNN